MPHHTHICAPTLFCVTESTKSVVVSHKNSIRNIYCIIYEIKITFFDIFGRYFVVIQSELFCFLRKADNPLR